MTREVLKSEYRAATEKMAEVMEFRHERCENLTRFAVQAATQQPQMAATALERVVDYLAVQQTEQARRLAAEAAKVYITLGKQVPAELQRLSTTSTSTQQPQQFQQLQRACGFR